MKEVQTQLGTRIVMLIHGGSITITKRADTEVVELTVHKVDSRKLVEALLTSDEALSLIEFLAVAARRGTGREIVEAPALPEALPDQSE
jgi:hypothetical protein